MKENKVLKIIDAVGRNYERWWGIWWSVAILLALIIYFVGR